MEMEHVQMVKPISRKTTAVFSISRRERISDLNIFLHNIYSTWALSPFGSPECSISFGKEDSHWYRIYDRGWNLTGCSRLNKCRSRDLNIAPVERLKTFLTKIPHFHRFSRYILHLLSKCYSAIGSCQHVFRLFIFRMQYDARNNIAAVLSRCIEINVWIQWRPVILSNWD